jgi:iron complex outermembrane receptor protein
MHNLFLDTYDATVDNWAARALLRYDATHDVSLAIKIHGAKNDAQAKQFKSQGLLDPASVMSGAPAPCVSPEIAGTCSDLLGYIDGPDPHSGQWDRRGTEEIEVAGASVTLTAMLGDFELTSISAYETTDRFIQPDTDGSPNQVLHIDWLDSNDQFTQELRLSSPLDSDIGWIAGVYYLNQAITIDQTNDVFRELRPMFGFDPSRLIFTVNTQIDQDLESYAAFGQIDYDLSDRFKLVAGLRYTSEQRDMSRRDALEEPAFSIPLVQLSDSVSFTNLSGKLALEYLDGRDNLAYASVSSGFKSGGFNGAVALDPSSVPPFDEETLMTFELGYKWTGFSDRLSINTAGFYTDYDDLQVFTRLTSGGIPRELLTNAANASVLGLEIEMTAITTEGLELRLGLGFLDTELKDFQTVGGADFSGNKLVGAPDFALNGLVRKDFQVGKGALTLQTNFHYQDDVFFETSNDPLLAQDAYWILGARISYRLSDKPWELALWGENLLDEEYLVGAVGLGVFGFNLQSWGEPRTWGIEFIWRQ